jgi:hypothetical protein
MSGNDLVRVWKNPDARGYVPHPAGDIVLDDLYGASANLLVTPTQEVLTIDCCGIFTGTSIA